MTQSISGWRRALAAVVAAVLAVTAILALNQGRAANAAENPNIEITVDTFNPPDPLNLYQPVSLKLAYDASNANPKPNDSFKVQLPEGMVFDSYGSAPMNTGDGVTVGECAWSSNSMTCTFNDAIAGKSDVKGTISIMMKATTALEPGEHQIKLSGDKRLVINLPGGAQYIGSDQEPLTSTQKRGIRTVGESTNELFWIIEFSTTSLGKQGGLSSLSFVDELQPGHVFYQGEAISNEEKARWVLLNLSNTDANGEPEDITSQVKFDLKFDGKTKVNVTITPNSGMLADNVNYRVQYVTYPDNGDQGAVAKGFSYENKVEIDGTQQVLNAEQSYVPAVTVTVEMKDGFGSFSVQKRITGDTSSLARDTKFKVQVDWTLPEGKAATDYPQWTDAPESNPYVMEVGAGDTVASKTFPVGTVIKLSETEHPQGVKITPFFAIDNTVRGDTGRLTIQNQTTTQVALRNVIEPDEKPAPSTPATPEPSTPSPSVTPSQSVTPSPTVTPSQSVTPSPTVTPSQSVTPSPTVTPSQSVTPSPTVTPSQSVTPSPTVTPSQSTSTSIPPSKEPTRTTSSSTPSSDKPSDDSPRDEPSHTQSPSAPVSIKPSQSSDEPNQPRDSSGKPSQAKPSSLPSTGAQGAFSLGLATVLAAVAAGALVNRRKR